MALVRLKTASKKTKTRAQLEAEASYAVFKAKWDAVPKFSRALPPSKDKAKKPTLESMKQDHGEQQSPSLAGKLDSGSTAPRATQQYTGTKMLGIGTMHKSNSVPVFSEQEAIDISTMRRD